MAIRIILEEKINEAIQLVKDCETVKIAYLTGITRRTIPVILPPTENNS
jgi:hypothetical protein